MEVHQLRYFLAVAQERHFGRAAARCHVAQPSLSQQIMKLEEELGERLFERGRDGVSLTSAGRVFRSHAERVMAELEQARRAVEEHRGVITGPVTLGALPTVAPYVLPRVLKAFGRRSPLVEVVVHEDVTASLVDAIERKELELGLVSLPVVGRSLQEVRLFTEELCVALPVNHPLGNKAHLKLGDLVDERFILMKEGHCLSGQTLQFCQARQLAPQVSFRSAQIETVRAFVAGGQGISLVPEMAAVPTRGVVYRKLEGEKPERALGIIFHKDRGLSPAASALVNFMVEALQGGELAPR